MLFFSSTMFAEGLRYLTVSHSGWEVAEPLVQTLNI